MADPPGAPAGGTATAADLESKEIWGDDADQLDDEVMKVCSVCLLALLSIYLSFHFVFCLWKLLFCKVGCTDTAQAAAHQQTVMYIQRADTLQWYSTVTTT